MANEKLFYIGVKGLIENEQGHILLLLADVTTHRKNTEPYWDIPGGRIEVGGNLIDTLQREIREETGITEFAALPVQITALLSNHQVPTGYGTDAGLALVVYKVSIANDAKITISQEHERYEWVSKAEAARRLSNKYPAEFTDAL